MNIENFEKLRSWIADEGHPVSMYNYRTHVTRDPDSGRLSFYSPERAHLIAFPSDILVSNGLYDCGTALCIAGAAEVLFPMRGRYILTLANALEISLDLAYALALPPKRPELGGSDNGYEFIAREEMLEALDYLWETGVVDWKRVFEQHGKS